MIGIYKLTSPSNKVYIGQSRNLEVRINNYRKSYPKCQTKLFNAFKKYKFENFSIEYLKTFEYYISDEKLQLLLDLYEKYFIKKYNSIKYGYNIREGGSRGKLSEESKNKISIANKNKVFSKEHLEKLSKSHKGYIMPEEQKIKISIKSKLKGISQETRTKMVNNRKGYKPTKETLEKSSNSHIKNKVLQFDLSNNLIKEWKSAIHAARELNYTVSCIYYACNGKMKTYKNYIWKYKSRS